MSDSAFIHKEAFWLLCSEKIGSGMGRDVYASKVLPDCVIKCESNAGSFQNQFEWETWQQVKNTPFAKWFAPCKWISACGGVLVMQRTHPIQPGHYPERVPAFLTDLKRTNYGLIGKQVVCHDYGTNLLIQMGLTKRMKKAEWWDV